MGITERIDAITKIAPEYRGEVLPAPKSVKIELTGRCNFRCSFCAQSHGLREQGDMDLDLFRRLAVEMRSAGVDELGLFYLGESFILPWLPEAIDFAKNEAGFPYVFLTTNGSLAFPERVGNCMMAGLDSLKFSLNYADPEQFSEIAGVKPALFNTMISNIKAAHRVRGAGSYKCGLYASFIQYDGEQAARMAETVAEVEPYLDEIYELPLYNQASLVEAGGALKEMTPGNRGRAGALRKPLPCWALFSGGHISWDGMLTGCCFSHIPDFDFGDLKEMSFMDAWNSERAQWFRRHHLAEDVTGTPCERCVVLT